MFAIQIPTVIECTKLSVTLRKAPFANRVRCNFRQNLIKMDILVQQLLFFDDPLDWNLLEIQLGPEYRPFEYQSKSEHVYAYLC